MRPPVRRYGFLLAALLAALLLPARAGRAGDKEEKARAAAAEQSFVAAYEGAGEDEKARGKAVESLRDAPDALKVGLLLDRVLPRDGAPRVLRASAGVLRTVKDADALKTLVREAQAKGDWGVRSVVIEGLGGIDDPAAVEGLVRIVKKGEARSAASALFALAERHPASALEEAAKAADHSQWQVRLAVLDYLACLRDPATLPLLCDRLEEEEGRLRHEVVETLKAVTGKDYKDDALKWRAYAAGGEAEAEKAGGGGGGGPGAGGRAVATGDPPVEPTYYGEKVYSDKIIFVVDLSLSMNEEMVIDRDTMVRETGAVVSGSDAETKEQKRKNGEIIPIEWWKIRNRKDFAVSQLKYVVSTLKRGQMFDIVWYSESVVAWQGRLTPAAPQIKVRAADWLDELKCEAGTNSWGGLTKALNLVGRGTDDENYSRGADTIYFMTDGMPSEGDIQDPDAIVDAVERIHKVRRVKIHVAQIGTSQLPWLKRLASVTGGNYRFFKAGEPKLPK